MQQQEAEEEHRRRQSLESEVETARDHSIDHPETTKRELWGWYAFDFATQPYSSGALAIFIPLILEDLAWRSGTSDPANPSWPPCLDRSLAANHSAADINAARCLVRFGWALTTPVAFALYCSSISVVLQVVSFVSLGAFADFSRWRKHFIIAFSVLNALTAFGFLLVITPGMYSFAALLAILGNVAYGTAMVFYNAYLPLLTEADPRIRSFKQSLDLEVSSAQSADLMGEVKSRRQPDLHNLSEHVSNELSTHGLAFGYVGGVLSLIVFFVILMSAGSQTYVMQICVALCGVVTLAGLFGFTVPWLQTRPGPAFPSFLQSYQIVLFSWKRTIKTIREAKKLKNTFWFLLSWFFYSDGYSSIASTAILFGKSALNMTNTQLLIISLVAPLTAIMGNYFFLKFCSQYLQMPSKRVLMLLIFLVSLLPLYGIIGLIVPESWPIGIKSVGEMYVVGALYGFLLGALQSFSRSIFGDLVPPGMESEFFALYEITDRGSSWLGPLLIGVFAGSFGVRYGFVVIFFILILSTPFMYMVDYQQGRIDAKLFNVKQTVDAIDEDQQELALTELHSISSD